MKLYYFETMNGRKACAVARHLALPVEYARIDLAKGEQKSPDYLAINPNGKIPALTDGDLKLWEADAIMCHLARVAGSDLWPADGRAVEVMRWLSWNTAHFTRHAGTIYFENLVKPRFGLGPQNQNAITEATGFVLQFGRVLDDHLRGRKYLLGDTLTVADFAVAVTLPYAEQARIPLEGFSEIQRWHNRLNELPAWRDPFPARTAAAA